MGTRHRGTKDEVRVLDAYIKLVRAAESVSTRLHQHVGDAGLTPSQFGALEALLHVGPMCQRDLGEKLLKSTGNITMVVDNLEKRGLVRRVRDVEDRRYVTVHLTEEGERLIRGIFPAHVRTILEQMSVLTPEEQEELGRLCRKLGRQERDKKERQDDRGTTGR
jgi:MarR family transcriptional regulator, 2-MHQ and catechol-resistance regulon repressor